MSEESNTDDSTLVDRGWVLPEQVPPVLDLTTTTWIVNGGADFDPNTVISKLNGNIGALCWYQPASYIPAVVALLVGIGVGVLVGACIWRRRIVPGGTTRSDHLQELQQLMRPHSPTIVVNNYPTTMTDIS